MLYIELGDAGHWDVRFNEKTVEPQQTKICSFAQMAVN